MAMEDPALEQRGRDKVCKLTFRDKERPRFKGVPMEYTPKIGISNFFTHHPQNSAQQFYNKHPKALRQTSAQLASACIRINMLGLRI